MCPPSPAPLRNDNACVLFLKYFRSSLEQSSDDIEQNDPPLEDTKKTKKKKETKVVCVHVHPGAIATPPQTAPHPFLHIVAPCRRNSRCRHRRGSRRSRSQFQSQKIIRTRKRSRKIGPKTRRTPPQKGKVPVSKVRLRGTCVPPLCTRSFPVVPDVPVPGYTCTRVLYRLFPHVPDVLERGYTCTRALYPRSQAFCTHSLSAQWRSALAASTQWRTQMPSPPPSEVGASSAGPVSVPVSPEQPRLTHSAL